MKSHPSGRRSRRSRGGSHRRGDRRSRHQETRASAPKLTFWQRLAAFFGNSKTEKKPASISRNGSQQLQPQQQQQQQRQQREPRPQRKPEPVEVSPPRLYVGTLSFDATESDLFELFNGVGHVENGEVVSYRHNQRSKGFAFVQMQNVEEAKRAVEELHDKEFLGRRLVVSGAKSGEHRAR